MTELERLLAETYGLGYRDPRLETDSADMSTADVLRRMPQFGPDSEWIAGPSVLPPLPPREPSYIENVRRPSDPMGPDEVVARELGDAARERNWPLAGGALAAAILGAAPGGSRGARVPPGRLAKAAEMSFDPTVYYQGRETPYPGRRAFQFVTDDPRMASWFADTSDARKGTKGGHVLPLLVNRNGFADLTSKADLERIAGKLSSRATQLRPGMSDREALGIAHEWLRDPKNIIDGRINWSVAEPFLWSTKEAGFPGAPVHETWGKWGAQNSHSLAIFDPSRIRSIYAAFDPAMRHSPNLLASGIGAAALAPLLAPYAAPELVERWGDLASILARYSYP